MTMTKWFVLAIITLSAEICVAQTKPTTKNQQPIKEEQNQVRFPKFSMAMIEGGRIEPGYAGIPVVAVVDAIEKMTRVKKGEFESTGDYNARRAAALAGKFLGDLSVQDTFVFVLPIGGANQILDNGFKYNFNADTSEVRLFVLPKSSSTNGGGGPEYPWHRSEGLDQFDTDFIINSRSTYSGTNAYGAKVTVEKTISTKLGIAANRIPFLTFTRQSYSYSNPVPVVQFKMANATAAKELPALKALVVMKLAEPYIVYNFISSTPTVNNPTEILNQAKYLTGNVLAIVFYSGLTGEIFARLPAQSDEPRTASLEKQPPPCVGFKADSWSNCFGTLTAPDGTTYVGGFRDGLLHGQGTLTIPNNSTYVGEFKNNLSNGQGTLTASDGTTYVGEFRDGLPNGQGTLKMTNGMKYVGEVKNSVPNGRGTLYDAHGAILQSGIWENNVLIRTH